jgi:hypothetical protein
MAKLTDPQTIAEMVRVCRVRRQLRPAVKLPNGIAAKSMTNKEPTVHMRHDRLKVAVLVRFGEMATPNVPLALQTVVGLAKYWAEFELCLAQ